MLQVFRHHREQGTSDPEKSEAEEPLSRDRIMVLLSQFEHLEGAFTGSYGC